MNVELRDRSVGQAVRESVIDCDIHTKFRSYEDLRPHLSQHWWDYLQAYGHRSRHGYVRGMPYPKASPIAARRDAWPPEGGMPGTSLAFMQQQLLDPLGIEYGIMNPLSPGQGVQNPEFSAALCHAGNEWQKEAMTSRDRRLRGSILVPYEDGTAARAEIEKRAGDDSFAQVLLLSRTGEPLGNRRYWPIYESAAAAGLPVGIHVFGYSGWAVTSAGWPSFYIEEMTEHAASSQAVVSSLVFEGVFERFPGLKVVLIEAGFGWIPALKWRLDKVWARMRGEVPHVTRPPSELIAEHVWVTTQPMEEPDKRQHLIDTLDWIGWDRVMFATDYPHLDFDDPRFALPVQIAPEKRRMILSENARRVYGLG